MTVVIGQLIGQSIRIHADTALSGGLDGKFEAVPGQLKAIVLDGRVSVAFSNHIDRALFAIGKARDALHSAGYVALVNVLEEHSTRTDPRYDNSVEFLVASHLPEPALRLVRDGRASDPGPLFRLGETTFADRIRVKADELRDHREIASEPAMPLSAAFSSAITYEGMNPYPNVGGVPVSLNASPYGHTYDGFGTTFTTQPEVIDLRTGLTADQLRDRNTGKSEFRVTVMSPSKRGVGVLGVVFAQGNLGFLYSPLRKGAPVRRAPLLKLQAPLSELDMAEFSKMEGEMQQQMRRLLNEEADIVGGGFEEPDEPLPWPDPLRRYF